MFGRSTEQFPRAAVSAPLPGAGSLPGLLYRYTFLVPHVDNDFFPGYNALKQILGICPEKRRTTHDSCPARAGTQMEKIT